MSQDNNIEIEKEVEEVEEVIQPKKKQLSLKQLEHLNNIRVKALEKKREIKLQKNKEYENKVDSRRKATQTGQGPVKPEVIEEPIKQKVISEIKAEVKSEVKKKRTIKKVIRYVETDSDDDDEEEVIKKEKKKPLPIQPPQQVEKSYNELLCESSLERMQSKIMNERAKHLITHIIPTYY